MLFGRAREEIDALVEAGIDFEVIPGVTAAFGASARLGVSLTERSVSRSVVLVTPRFGDGECAHDWVRAAVAADTAVIYMARGQADAVLCGLRSGGMRDMTPVALVENATWETEFVRYGRLYELPALASQLGPGPALIITGEVLRTAVSLEQRARAVRRVAASAMPTGVG